VAELLLGPDEDQASLKPTPQPDVSLMQSQLANATPLNPSYAHAFAIGCRWKTKLPSVQLFSFFYQRPAVGGFAEFAGSMAVR
jgi:hypothetical protein